MRINGTLKKVQYPSYVLIDRCPGPVGELCLSCSKQAVLDLRCGRRFGGRRPRRQPMQVNRHSRARLRLLLCESRADSSWVASRNVVQLGVGMPPERGRLAPLGAC